MDVVDLLADAVTEFAVNVELALEVLSVGGGEAVILVLERVFAFVLDRELDVLDLDDDEGVGPPRLEPAEGRHGKLLASL